MVEQVADLLRLSERHVRRLAPTIGGHKTRSGPWVFDRASVEVYLLDITERRTA